MQFKGVFILSDKYYNEDGSIYSYRDKKRHESTQEHWNRFYADKQWIDTKGWCDLNGNPLPFERDEYFPKSKSVKHSDNEVNVVNFLLSTIAKLLVLSVLTIIALFKFNSTVYPIVTILFLVIAVSILIRMFIKILKQ